MSGRIRSIKPELLEDAVTAGLSETAFRLFIGTIALADDYGVFRAEAGYLAGQVFWRVPPSRPIEDAIAELGAKLVQLFEVNGQRYGAIRTWAKHQKVSHPGKRRLPAPPEEFRITPESLRRSSGESPEILARPSGGSPEILARPSGEPPDMLAKTSGEPPEILVPDLRPSIIDHRPSTPDPREGVGEGERSEVVRRAPELQPVGLFGLELETFREGVTAGLGRPVAAPASFALRDLRRGLEAHAPRGLGAEALVAWLRSDVERWARMHAAPHLARYQSGFAPNAWVRWRDANCPDPMAAQTNGRNAVQPVAKAGRSWTVGTLAVAR